MAATLGLVLVPVVGHAASQGLAWAPMAAGTAAAGAIVLYGHRPIHLWWAAGAGAAGAWTAAAWWVGLADPIVAGSFVVLLASVAWVWIRYAHPRARVRVIGGSVWPWQWERWQFQRVARREIAAAMASWLVASYWGRVPRSEIRAAVADIEADLYLLTVELVPGHIDLDLDNRRAASAIEAPVAHVVVIQSERDGNQPANVVQVEWYHDGLPAAEEAPEEAEQQAVRPSPVDLEAERLERLAAALARIGPRTISARGLAEEACLPHDWVNRHITKLAPRLGLRRVKGGWQRLAMAAGGDGP